LPGSSADTVGFNPPYVKSFQGGLLGTVGGTAIAPGVPNSAVDATVAANQTFSSGFTQAQLSCASAQANPATCLPAVAITAVPDGELHAPYFMEWSLGLEHQLGTTGSIHAQVGTRAVNQPYLTQVNGYQTVCDGCFAPFPYARSTDPRFGAVTQFSTGANSRDYDIRHNLNAQYVYQLPVKVQNRLLRSALNGWQVSGTVFWHSWIPFSVLSTPYSANGNGIVNGSGHQFASVVPGVPLYEHNSIPGVTQPGTVQWLNPDAFVSTVDPSTGACFGGDSPKNCQFGSLGRNALRGPNFAWSDFYLTKSFPLTERVRLRFDTQFFNHPNFGLPSMVLAGIPGKPSTQTGFGTLTYTTSPPTGLLGVGLGGDSTPRMIAFQLRLEF
jgi:hypothetical protein